MPEPSKNSIDYILFYQNINKFVYKICNTNITPNMITISSILLLYPIYYAIRNKKIYHVLFLILFRHFIDCLDGQVARKCNKVSEFGNYLDIFTDMLFYTVILFAGITLKYKTLNNIYCLGLIFIIVYGIVMSTCNIENHKMKNNVLKWFTDNGIISWILVWLIWIN